MKAVTSLLVGFAALSATGWAAQSEISFESMDSEAIRAQVDKADRMSTVKAAFRYCWQGYRKFAFPNDELRPLSNSSFNSRNHWGASAVDALGTAILMDLDDVVDDILGFIPSIDFNSPEGKVDLFETTIRYMGGLMSAYDLLTGPKADLVADQSKISPLLNQAVKLANRLKAAFETPTGIPYNTVDFSARGPAGQETNLLATVGSLVLEWTHLSDLTGNQEYAQLAQRAQSFLLSPSPAEAEPFPGLLGANIDLVSGQFRDNWGGWGGGSDSFYEYLIKAYVYDPARFGFYRDRWIQAAESTIRFLTSHPESRPDLTFVARYNGRNLIQIGEHLTCFHGGNFLLGGSILRRRDFVKYGLRLVDTCHALYNSTVSGVAPETYAWSAPAPAGQEDFFEKNGFWVRDASYLLRPEMIESFYYAYRMTGFEVYRDWAWESFISINNIARAPVGFTAVKNVMASDGGQRYDFQESFIFAELLKYMYLIFADSAPVHAVTDLARSSWVFTTEGHPLRSIR